MMKRKWNIFLAFCFSVLCALSLFACGAKKDTGALVCSLVENGSTRVVISVGDTDGNCTLLDCMEKLKMDEEGFTFEIASGMVTSINGVENPADWSYCWMLYTSDVEMANAEWGTVKYKDATLGSAIVGANALTVTAGEIYVWEYVAF